MNAETLLRPRSRGFRRLQRHTAELLDEVLFREQVFLVCRYTERVDAALLPAAWVDVLDYAASEPYLAEMVAEIENPAWVSWDGMVVRERADRGRDLRGRLRALLDGVRAEPGVVVDVWWRGQAQASLVSVRLLQRAQALAAQPEVLSALAETWRMVQATRSPNLRLIQSAG